MSDTRLTRALALLDDARTELAELTAEGHPARNLNYARFHINAAIVQIQKANGESHA